MDCRKESDMTERLSLSTFLFSEVELPDQAAAPFSLFLEGPLYCCPQVPTLSSPPAVREGPSAFTSSPTLAIFRVSGQWPP